MVKQEEDTLKVKWNQEVSENCILKKKNDLKNKRKVHAICELDHDLSKSILIYLIFRWGRDSRQIHAGEQLVRVCRWFLQPSQEQRSHLRRTNSLFWKSILQWPHQIGGIAEQSYSSFKTYWWQLVGVLNELSLQRKSICPKLLKADGLSAQSRCICSGILLFVFSCVISQKSLCSQQK